MHTELAFSRILSSFCYVVKYLNNLKTWFTLRIDKCKDEVQKTILAIAGESLENPFRYILWVEERNEAIGVENWKFIWKGSILIFHNEFIRLSSAEGENKFFGFMWCASRFTQFSHAPSYAITRWMLFSDPTRTYRKYRSWELLAEMWTRLQNFDIFAKAFPAVMFPEKSPGERQ